MICGVLSRPVHNPAPGHSLAWHRELGVDGDAARESGGRGALDYFRPTSRLLRLIELGKSLERLPPVDSYRQGPDRMHIIHKG